MIRRPGSRRFNELAGTGVERLAGLSDGIFAVGMTLLVLGLAVPTLSGGASNLDLWHAMAGLVPNILIYTMSFITLGIFWLGQSTQLSQLARGDRHFVWIHLLFLFAVTLVPFSTSLLAHFCTLQLALVEYWLNIVLLGFTLLGAAEYAQRAQLFKEEIRAETIHLIRGRIWIAQVLYALAVAPSIFLPTWVSIGLVILIQLNYLFAPPIPFLRRF